MFESTDGTVAQHHWRSIGPALPGLLAIVFAWSGPAGASARRPRRQPEDNRPGVAAPAAVFDEPLRQFDLKRHGGRARFGERSLYRLFRLLVRKFCDADRLGAGQGELSVVADLNLASLA